MPKSDFPTKPLTEENVLSVLPASPGDIMFYLGDPEGGYGNRAALDKLRTMLSKLQAERKIFGRSRTADDPVYYIAKDAS